MSSKAEVRSAQVAGIGEMPGLLGDTDASSKLGTTPAAKQPTSEMFGTPGTRAVSFVPSLATVTEADAVGQAEKRRVATVAPIAHVGKGADQSGVPEGTEVYKAAGISTGQAGGDARKTDTGRPGETAFGGAGTPGKPPRDGRGRGMPDDEGDHARFERYPPFPAAVLQEARQARLTPEIMAGRRNIEVVTFDRKGAPDLDDALPVELERTNTGFILSLSYADVASVIAQDSATDREAAKRGFTHYYARGTSHMLPKDYSHKLVSMVPGDNPHPALTVHIPLEKRGGLLVPGKPRYELTAAKNVGRYSHEEVDHILADPSAQHHDQFTEYAKIAQQLLRQRRAEGALAFYDFKHGIITDEEGNIKNISRAESHLAFVIVQEMNILAYSAIAADLADRGVLALFRNHTVQADSQYRGDRIRQLQMAMERPEGVDIDRILAGRDRPVFLSKARYGPDNQGHYGLNIPAYLHLSPLRRFAGLVNQRIIIADATGQEPPYTKEQLLAIGQLIFDKTEEDKEQRSAHFKALAQQVARQTATADRVHDVGEKMFGKVLSVVAEEGGLTPTIAVEAIARLHEHELTFPQMMTILLDPQESTVEWKELQKEVLMYLQESPHHASSLMNTIIQNRDWQLPEHQTQRSNSSQEAQYFTRTTLRVGDEEFVSNEMQAGKKDRAEQLGIISAFANMLEIELPERQESGRPAMIPGGTRATITELPAPVGDLPELNVQDLQLASSKLLTKILQRAASTNILQPSISEEVKTRLRDERLTVIDIMTILTEPRERTDDWKDLQRDVLVWLQENPQSAASLMNTLLQFHWLPPEHHTVVSGPDNDREFSTQTTLKVSNNEFTSSQVKAKKLALSEQLGIVGALANMLDIQLPEAENGGLKDSKKAQLQAKNPITVLNELSMSHGVGPADITVIQEGPPHAPTFKASARVDVQGSLVEIYDITLSGGRKKDVERAVAALLLEKVQEVLAQKPPTTQEQTAQMQNPVGALNDLGQRNRFESPVYDVVQTGLEHRPSFSAKASVRIRGVEVTAEITGALTSKDAKRAAAASLLPKVQKLLGQQTGGEQVAYTSASAGISPDSPMKPINVVAGDFMGALITLTSRRGWTRPNISESQVKGKSPFSCTIVVETDEGPKTFTATGINKFEAKKKAARAAFINFYS